MVITPMSTMPVEQMHQWTSQQQQVRRQTQHMAPVLTQEEKAHDHRQRNARECRWTTPGRWRPGMTGVVVRSSHVYPQFHWIEPGSDSKVALKLAT